jgi:transcription elongation factor GreA
LQKLAEASRIEQLEMTFQGQTITDRNTMPAADLTNGTQGTQLTQQGYAEIEKELKELEETKLPAVIKRVELARQNGDLSENSEYHNAKEDQELIETRIAELKNALVNATIVQSTSSNSKVGMGSQVTVSVKSMRTKRKATFTIVGDYEANPKEGKISSSSPLGKALVGKKKSDQFAVDVPAGKMEYEVLEIH